MKKEILTQDEIVTICKDIANKLNKKFKDAKFPPVIIGVLKGALPFMMELVKYIEIPVKYDFVQISSYSGTDRTGAILIKKDVTMNVKSRDVIVVEDIVDTGYTMVYLCDYLKKKYGVNSITSVSLLDKKCRRKVPFDVDYAGKEIENEFVVGFGLDYYELSRNTPNVFVPDENDLKIWDDIVSKEQQ